MIWVWVWVVSSFFIEAQADFVAQPNQLTFIWQRFVYNRACNEHSNSCQTVEPISAQLIRSIQ